jgi:hypothetical protein
MRMAESFTIEAEVNEYADTTKGKRSASERVNELLKLAIAQEQTARLEAAVAEFFASANAVRTEAKAFQKESLRSFRRA